MIVMIVAQRDGRILDILNFCQGVSPKTNKKSIMELIFPDKEIKIIFQAT
jgi:hypothetical protein